MIVEEVYGLVDRVMRVAIFHRHLGDPVMKDSVVARHGSLDPARPGRIDRFGTGVALAEVLHMFGRFHAIHLPAKVLDLVGALHVPLSEIPCAITGASQALGKVRLVGPQHALVVVADVLDLKHAMVVRQQSSHQAGPRRRAGRGRAVGPPAHSPRRETIHVWRQARRPRQHGPRLHRVGDEEEDIGFRGHGATTVTKASTECEP